jgi:hypothetical protein
MALALPNRSRGNAFHWQPVRNTYRMPSNTTRASLGLRPPPGLRANFRRAGRPGRGGISNSTRSQKASNTTHDSSLVFAIAFLCPAHWRRRKNSLLHYLRMGAKGTCGRSTMTTGSARRGGHAANNSAIAAVAVSQTSVSLSSWCIRTNRRCGPTRPHRSPPPTAPSAAPASS